MASKYDTKLCLKMHFLISIYLEIVIAFTSDSFTKYTAITEIYMSRALQSISLLVRCKNNRNILGMDISSFFVYIFRKKP